MHCRIKCAQKSNINTVDKYLKYVEHICISPSFPAVHPSAGALYKYNDVFVYKSYYYVG